MNKEIIVAGLDWNCLKDIPFNTTVGLMGAADQVIKLTAKCEIENCQNRAIRSQYKGKLPFDFKEITKEMENCSSRCRFHYEPINKDW